VPECVQQVLSCRARQLAGNHRMERATDARGGLTRRGDAGLSNYECRIIVVVKLSLGEG